MRKAWQVALEELRRTVFKRSFILVLLMVPLFLALMIGPGILLETLKEDDRPVGYVDRSGVLAEPRALPHAEGERQIGLRAFPDEGAARQALDAQEIQAYFLTSPDYPAGQQVELVYQQEPDPLATRTFRRFLQWNLLQNVPDPIAWRAMEGAQLTYRNPEATRTFPNGGPPLRVVLPLALGLGFGGLLLTGSGSLMSGLAEEKASRTMEVLATSLAPARLVMGKLIGILLINLIQLAFWILVALLAIWVAGDLFGVAWFQHVAPDWQSLLAVTAVSIPGYVFASALMFAVGSTVLESQEGQSFGGMLFLVLMLPVYLLIPIAQQPEGSLAVALSLLPLTSMLTVGLRNMLAIVPLWQVAASVAVQSLAAGGMLWLAGRAFRLGMLRYGKRLRLSEVLPIGRARTRA